MNNLKERVLMAVKMLPNGMYKISCIAAHELVEQSLIAHLFRQAVADVSEDLPRISEAGIADSSVKLAAVYCEELPVFEAKQEE